MSDVQFSVDEHRAPIRIITIQVKEVIVGKINTDIVVLNFPIFDYEGNKRSLNPRFAIGEDVIIHLQHDIINGGWVSLGHDQGKFTITGATVEGSKISVEQFKRQIKDVALSRATSIDVPPRLVKDDFGDYSGEGISKLGGEFHLLDPQRYGPTSGTIEFKLNPSNAKDKNGNSISFANVKAAIQRAIDSWNNVTHSYVTFSISTTQYSSARVNGNGVSSITFESDASLGSNGAAWVLYSNGIITEIDLAFNYDNRWNTDVQYPSSYPTYNHPRRGVIGPVDLEDVAAHELGHAVGLHHVGDSKSTYTLYPTVYTDSQWWEKTWRRSLESGDNSGKVYQYPSSSISLSGNLPFSLLYAAKPNFTLSADVSSNLTIGSGSSFSFESDDKGTFNLSNNVTITVNGSFQLTSGSTVIFNGSSSKLYITGTLTANGGYSDMITFTSSSGTWYGIEFWNGESGSEIRWSNINNAEYGVRMYNTNVVLEDNSIKYNTTGLRFENQSDGAGIIRGNVVAENNDNGIECVQYSDPLLFSSNVIRYNNFYGVYGDNTSAPDLGRYSDQGHNSIYYNGDDVWSTYGGTIYALYNWWGEYPAYPTVSYNVDYSNALSYDPNPGMGKAAANALSFENRHRSLKGNFAADTLGMTEVNQAYQVFLDGKLEQALALFDGIVQKYPEYFSGRRALAFMDRTLGKLNQKTESLSRLNAIAAAHPSLEIAGLANSITVGYLIKSAQYTDAVTKSQAILNGFPKTTLAKYALYDLGSLYWYRLEDQKTGETYFRELIAEWPEDDLSISALATLGEWKPKPVQSNGPALAKAQNVPTAYALAQNFPNPFNPQTLIQYQLPEANHLTLKIYNLFGQEIRTLFDGQREAGYHSAIWNGRDDFGRNAASGVYFYRLSTKPSAAQPNGFARTRKMVLMQ